MNLFFVIIPNLTANASLNGQVQNGVATLHVLLLFDFPIDYWMEHWWEMGYILEIFNTTHKSSKRIKTKDNI